jgi:hypothetical protein
MRVVYLRLVLALVFLGISTSIGAQPSQVPGVSSPATGLPGESKLVSGSGGFSSSTDSSWPPESDGGTGFGQATPSAASPAQASQHPATNANAPVDANGNPIPLDRQEPKRILGFMPNFRTVAGGAKPPPPGWKYNFSVATNQATDYSSFLFLGITSLTAEATDAHPALGKGADGFYAYSWRGFLDKTDNTYLSAWLLSSLLHEDTRYYALGSGHSIPFRALYVISRQAVARTYGGRQTPNIAGLGAKVLTQVFSRYYYPSSADSFSALATKFSYSVMRDVAFSAIREFYPDVAAHYIKKHREKMARLAAAQGADSVH